MSGLENIEAQRFKKVVDFHFITLHFAHLDRSLHRSVFMAQSAVKSNGASKILVAGVTKLTSAACGLQVARLDSEKTGVHFFGRN